MVIEEKEDDNEIKIDWNLLKNINEDIVAWIRIDGTNINYPILKDNGKLKYLNHSYNGNYNRNGSIFTLNNNSFEKEITTVYGHNMRNGTMFSELVKYMNKDFFNKHIEFEVYTSNTNYRATVFSAYLIDVYEEEENIKTLGLEDEIDYYKNLSKFYNENIGETKKS